MAEWRRARGGPRRWRVLLGLALALTIPLAAWFMPVTAGTAVRAVPEDVDARPHRARPAAVGQWTPSDVVYRRTRRSDGSNVDLRVDVYRPATSSHEVRPVVVVLHPGGFAFGDRTDPGTVSLAEEFAARGYVAVAPDYRTRPNFAFTMNDTATLALGVADARDDVLGAIDWVERHSTTLGVDPSRIVVVGRSAGAMTALALASDDVTAVVSSAGCWVGGPELTQASAPALLIHGANDTVVPPTCAAETAATADAGGESVELVLLPGIWHEATDASVQWWDAVDSFLGRVGLRA